MTAQTLNTPTRPVFDLATEYWQRQEWALYRQRKTLDGVFVSTQICTLNVAALDSYNEARQTMRLLQATPELLRLLITLTSDRMDSFDDISARADAEALIASLIGD